MNKRIHLNRRALSAIVCLTTIKEVMNEWGQKFSSLENLLTGSYLAMSSFNNIKEHNKLYSLSMLFTCGGHLLSFVCTDTCKMRKRERSKTCSITCNRYTKWNMYIGKKVSLWPASFWKYKNKKNINIVKPQVSKFVDKFETK